MTSSDRAKRVLAVPPDITRLHSRAGDLTRYAWEHYGDRLKAVLPALGTHAPMRPAQIAHMFGGMPQDRFRIHNWRTDIETLGEVPAAYHSRAIGRASSNYSVAGAGESPAVRRAAST